jgi:hypothetical protein
MRRFLTIFCAVLLFAGSVMYLIHSRRFSREKALPDGSVIRIEEIAFAKDYTNNLKGPFDRLKYLVPAKVKGLLPSLFPPPGGQSTWWQNSTIRTNQEALYVYMSRHDAATHGYMKIDWEMSRAVELVDEHGCAFKATRCGGFDDGKFASGFSGAATGRPGSSIMWFRFEAFPREEKNLRLRVYDSSQFKTFYGQDTNIAPPASVDFLVSNPAPPPKTADWQAQNLPVTQSFDKVSFALTNILLKTNRTFQFHLAPKYEITEDGQPSTNWQALDTRIFDSSGNFAADNYGSGIFLCPHEPAWKLVTKFFGSEKSGAASNTAWTIHGLEIPAPGKTIALNGSNILQGITIKAITFAGPGEYTYSNGVPLEAAGLGGREETDYSRVISWPRNWNGRNSPEKPTFMVHSKKPHLAFDISELGDDQRLTIRVVDDLGREFYGHATWGGSYAASNANKRDKANYMDNFPDGQGTFASFDLPADSKTVDLTFCVHSCTTVEFVFKPPAAGSNMGAR